jgi:hypothetical protein
MANENEQENEVEGADQTPSGAEGSESKNESAESENTAKGSGKKNSSKEKPKDEAKTGTKLVVNAECAGLTLYGVNGNKIEFDENGEAAVEADDFEHFLKVPGYEEKK